MPALAEVREAAPRGIKTDEVRVLVRGGYQPATIFARAGRPLRIVFRREENAFCSERVIFPAFGKSAMLPPHEDITVELLPERPGEYEFTCQLGMLHGTLIVSGDAAASQEDTAA